MIEISTKSKTITIKECYGTDAQDGATFLAEYKEGKVIAVGEEKDFYKWSIPTFKFEDKNNDTLIYITGVGSDKLTKTKLKMPNIAYSKSKKYNQ